MMTPRVTDIAFKAAPRAMEARGLLGWVRFTLDGRYGVDGVGVRRTASGRLALAFPERIDGHGRAHSVLRPLDVATRRGIEVQVFDALARDGGLAS
ncbi:MAG: hypothetical protein L6Q99_07295 [Planctomycetes bacterium]|nr:hypothetical protein [Planctomycetota bacterium]